MRKNPSNSIHIWEKVPGKQEILEAWLPGSNTRAILCSSSHSCSLLCSRRSLPVWRFPRHLQRGQSDAGGKVHLGLLGHRNCFPSGPRVPRAAPQGTALLWCYLHIPGTRRRLKPKDAHLGFTSYVAGSVVVIYSVARGRLVPDMWIWYMHTSYLSFFYTGKIFGE